MNFQFDATPVDTAATDCRVMFAPQGEATADVLNTLPAPLVAMAQRAAREGDFTGKLGNTLLLMTPEGTPARRLLLVGTGSGTDRDRDLVKALQAAVVSLKKTPAARALLVPAELPTTRSMSDRVDLLVRLFDAALYEMHTCKGDAARAKVTPPKLTDVVLAGSDADAAAIRRGLAAGEAAAAGIRLAKDLGNLPGNLCTPTYLAETAQRLASELPISTTVLEQADMERHGMGALLSVSKGSRQPPKLIIMDYQGGKKGAKPVALVGKGLTFDAGGISIKPAAKMDEMKFDMCGAAAVFGALKAAALLELPINLVGVVPASENLPDGAANKPGDIVTSMAGITIEVLNTDAEGRLILCDALTYTQKFYEPEVCIDLATLTGACVVALGNPATGLFSNDDALAGELLTAGETALDRAWRLPLWEEYDDQLFSDFADLPNIATRGAGEAGAVVAAMFLHRFTKDMRWAHMDIAGSSWVGKKASGRPVALLTRFLQARADDVQA